MWKITSKVHCYRTLKLLIGHNIQLLNETFSFMRKVTISGNNFPTRKGGHYGECLKSPTEQQSRSCTVQTASQYPHTKHATLLKHALK